MCQWSDNSQRSVRTEMQTTDGLRVAVVGGGLCGLACAIALLKEKVDVEVYEAAVGTRLHYRCKYYGSLNA